MSSVNYKSHLKIPIFDGTDYPFWKEKIKIHQRAIDDDMWNMVHLGFTVVILEAPTDEEKKLIQLDAQAKDEIGGHLSRAQFLRYHHCETAKELWMSSKRSMKEFQLRKKLELILFWRSLIASSALEMRAVSKPSTTSVT